MTSSRTKPSIGWLPLALIAITVALFFATGMLYVTQTRNRSLMTQTIRSSGWVAYQAELEYVKADSALAVAAIAPNADALAAAELRLEILRSRLPLLYNSDEGRVLRDVIDLEKPVHAAETLLDGLMDRLPAISPTDPGAAETLLAIQKDMAPIGTTLKRILMESVAYNQEIFRRERALAEAPGMVPLLLLFVSGTCLALVLLLQSRRDRLRLDAIVAAQKTVIAMEENLRAIIEAMPACMIVINPQDDSVSFVNSAASALVNLPLDHAEWRRLVHAAFQAAIDSSGDRWGMLNMSYARISGDITSLRGSLCRVIWEGRPQLLLVMVDVSRVRRAELQVMQAAKLATLGEMATAIAHELNQPLAVIRMAVANANRLLTQIEGGELVAGKLDRISAQVDRAKRITDQVRRYGRMPSEENEPFPLRHAVDLAMSFVADHYRSANIRLALEADIAADTLVMGEQTMFEQVIVNLLVNARDAFESSGVRTARSVVVRVRVHEDEAVIEVEDNAGGIAEEVMPRLFEPFSTTKPTEKGTGLGLSIARSVIRDMHGTIGAENVAGGARFVIALPLRHAARNAA
ncbi:sensor histidine kinase [Ancylobacter lacus]|uniref:sensor histidine kinase n=1 Tax=Ancylobacter lacus TaxID=2579970 RepID=UPI001BCD6BE5|nr:ATP-binding protein [Ancylobacter lacus]MBS7538416.1 hypothetical protein [Ancylobacter lacus]